MTRDDDRYCVGRSLSCSLSGRYILNSSAPSKLALHTVSVVLAEAPYRSIGKDDIFLLSPVHDIMHLRAFGPQFAASEAWN